MARIPRMLRLIRVLRIMKIVKIGQVMEGLEHQFNISAGVGRTFKTFFFMAVVTHVLA